MKITSGFILITCSMVISWVSQQIIIILCKLVYLFICLFIAVGNFLKAVESAATYLAIDPSSETMANNLHYYMTTFKLESKEVIPREVSS